MPIHFYIHTYYIDHSRKTNQLERSGAYQKRQVCVTYNSGPQRSSKFFYETYVRRQGIRFYRVRLLTELETY